MENKHALEILKQAVNIAIGSNLFKEEKDVIVIYQAFAKVKELLKDDKDAKETQAKENAEIAPKASKKSKNK